MFDSIIKNEIFVTPPKRYVRARRDMYGFEFPTEEWRQITAFISLDCPRRMVEFRVYTAGAADINIDLVEIKRMTTPTSAKYSTYTYRDLIFTGGHVTEDKLMRHDPDNDGGGFWTVHTSVFQRESTKSRTT